jgi:putative ABC transport system permease protein
MTFADTAHLALRNLRQAKLRTSLTSMGVAIGIASLAGMVSLGVGLQDQVVGSFMRSGLFDTITVSPLQPRGGGFPGRAGDLPGARAQAQLAFGRRGRGGAGASPDTPRRALDEAALKEIGALPRVSHVYPNLRVPVQIAFEQQSEFVAAAGVPMFANGEGAYQTFAAGGFFRNDTDNACILTVDFAKRLTPREPAELIGQQVTITYAAAGTGGSAPAADASVQLQRMTASYTIVGLVARDSSGIGAAIGGQSGLMIPLARAEAISADQVTNAQSLLREPSGPSGYQSVTVNVARAQDAQDVEARIKTLGFQAFSLTDALQGAKRAFILLDIFLSLIGSIALAVSSLGIINTMVMSILERTREIGIMKAIGASHADIRRIFLIEASSIGVLGGIAGVAIGWVVGRIINAGANYYIVSQGGAAGNFFSLPFWLVAGAIAFSVLVSLIAGSYPAARAARLDPIQALRHD